MASHDKEAAMETLGTCKGRVGKFHYYHQGSSSWLVTDGEGGEIVARKRNLSEASQTASHLYDLSRRNG
jgi:hypothetical protein